MTRQALFNRKAVMLGALLLSLLAVAGFGLYEAGWREIVSVRVAGELHYTPRGELQRAVAAFANRSLYQVDVEAIRRAALEQAWVKHASVRRVWPDALHIAVIEREPVARWGEDGLMEADASVFYPPGLQGFETLPRLHGPEGREVQVLRRYAELSQLLGPVSRRIVHLSLDERHAWRLVLDNGVEILMGQSERNAALGQLVDVLHRVLRADPSELQRVDLRYTNGFAVLWKEAPEAQEKEDQG